MVQLMRFFFLGFLGLASILFMSGFGTQKQVAVTNVEVRCIDMETGQVTPCMVCLRSMEDGQVRLPPDGKVLQQMSRLEEFEQGIPYDENNRNWIGPVRRMVGEGDDFDRSIDYPAHMNSLPYWNEPVMYQTSGNFSIELPKGKWRLSVSHGMEYVPVVQEFETPGDGTTRRVELHRWIHMANKGWYSGDVHVHHPTVTEQDRQYMLSYAVAEDLHVSSMLEWSHHFRDRCGNITTQYKVNGFGKNFRVHRDDYWLVSGQEDQSQIGSMWGCITALNTEALVPYTEETDGFLDKFYKDWHSSPDAVVGFPHFGSWNRDSPGFTWSVTTEDIEFVELLQFMEYSTKEYYEYLNLGFKLTAAAGSDAFWGSTLGEVRTYVYTGSPLNIDGWFANLKKGHTFITNGPVLEFTVDGKLPGSEIEKTRESTVHVVAKVLGHPKVALPESFAIVGNKGEILATTNREDKETLTLEFDHPIQGSQWIAAHTTATNGAVAHTTPVYIIVDGQPFWDRSLGPTIIGKKLNLLRAVEKELVGENGGNAEGKLSRIRKAMNYYTDLEKRMAQTSP